MEYSCLFRPSRFTIANPQSQGKSHLQRAPPGCLRSRTAYPRYLEDGANEGSSEVLEKSALRHEMKTAYKQSVRT